MKKIFCSVRLGELSTDADNICDIAKEFNTIVEATFVSIVSVLTGLAASLNLALKRQLVKSNLDELDRRRDKAMTLLRGLVAQLKRYPASKQNVADAARRVLVVIDNYRSMTRKNFNEQSAWTKSLLTDFQETSVATDLALLPGVDVAVEELKDAEQAFRVARLDYQKRYSGRGDAASKLKKPLLDVINCQLVPYLTAMASVDDDTWGEMARRVAAVIDEQNEVIRRRRTLGDKADADAKGNDQSEPVDPGLSENPQPAPGDGTGNSGSGSGTGTGTGTGSGTGTGNTGNTGSKGSDDDSMPAA